MQNLPLLIDNEYFRHKKWAVAVSGGSDSLGLLHYVLSITKHYNISIIPIHVDLNLRAESSQEALELHANLAQHGIKLTILTNNLPIKNNLHHQARQVRYDLMMDFCLENNIKILCLGHHGLDKYENFFLRLIRGTGLAGLVSPQIATKFIHKNQEIIFLRPFINQDKQILSEYAKIWQFAPIIDKNNDNIKFTRAQVRQLTPQLQAIGLNQQKILLAMDNIAQAWHYILGKIHPLIQANFSQELGAFCVKRDFFADVYLAEQGLLIIFQAINLDFAPKFAKIKRLIARQETTIIGKWRCEFIDGDLWISANQANYLHFFQPIALPDNVSADFFWAACNISKTTAQKLKISQPRISASAFKSLPALFHGNKILAMPHCNYWQMEKFAVDIKLRQLGLDSAVAG